MTARSWWRLGVACVVALVVQVCLLDNLTVIGAHPDLMVLVAAAGGMVAGPQRGAIAGFVSGLLADLVVSLPFGLSPLSFVVVGFSCGLAGQQLGAHDTRSVEVAACALACLGGTVLYAVVGTVAGQHGLLGLDTAAAVVSVTLGAVVMGYPVLGAMRSVFSGTRKELGLGVPHGGSAVG